MLVAILASERELDLPSATLDNNAALLAAIASNAAFFLLQLLELVLLRSRRVETFRTEAIFQIRAGKRQMTVAAAQSSCRLRQHLQRGVGAGTHPWQYRGWGL